MLEFLRTVLYQPLYNLFILIVALIPNHNIGIAIIILTVLVRIALYPLKKKSIASQFKQKELQPELKRLQELHKDDRAGLAAAQMQLYKDKGINPLSGCLPLLVQLPILIVLYYVFSSGLKAESTNLLYSFVKAPESIQTSFLWLKDLTQRDHTMIFPLLAGLAQFFFSKSLMASMPQSSGSKEEDMASIVNKQLMYFAPVMTVLIGRQFPAGLSLYWAVASLVDWYQQVSLTKKLEREAKVNGKTRIQVRRKGQSS